MRGIVGRCNKIDVMTTLVLETQHHTCNYHWCDLISRAKMANSIVLTIHTKKVTMGEEDSAGSTTSMSKKSREREFSASNEGFFFSEMRMIARNH
jgi:hypothetical protein